MKYLRIEKSDGVTWIEWNLDDIKSVKIVDMLYPEEKELEKK